MELIVKIQSAGSNPSYQDGDVVQAMSLDQIYMVHAEMICNVSNFGFNTQGLRDTGTLLEKFEQSTKTYKFERLNSNDVKRTNLITLEESIINTIPNTDGESMNVYQYISRRLKSNRHKIFGSQGSEIWYGKSKTHDSSIITSVWNDIETETTNLQVNNRNWPFTPREKRGFVCINTSGRDYTGESFTRVELSGDTVHERAIPAFEADPVEIPEDYDPVILAKRKWFVPYWDLSTELGNNVDDIRNNSIECDCRKPTEEREHIDILTYDKITEGLL
tara:strand:- start:10209 stop:11036 length:828 start_codon:yes stop_codon:yes gene_type:complete